MINIVTKELKFDEELKKRIEFICDFCNITPTIINGKIRNVDKTNLSYIEPQLEDIQEIVPDYYIANATIHFDEHSPHMHIIGVPVKDNCKTGLSRQVGKTYIFTKE